MKLSARRACARRATQNAFRLSRPKPYFVYSETKTALRAFVPFLVIDERE
jgi:hypothetical protein